MDCGGGPAPAACHGRSFDLAPTAHHHSHVHIEDIGDLFMKTERVTLLATPQFKAFLGVEAAREGVCVAELVRSRCEQRPDAEGALLASLAADLRKAVREAAASLKGGLAEADSVLAELRARREGAAGGAALVPRKPRKPRKPSAATPA